MSLSNTTPISSHYGSLGASAVPSNSAMLQGKKESIEKFIT